MKMRFMVNMKVRARNRLPDAEFVSNALWEAVDYHAYDSITACGEKNPLEIEGLSELYAMAFGSKRKWRIESCHDTYAKAFRAKCKAERDCVLTDGEEYAVLKFNFSTGVWKKEGQ